MSVNSIRFSICKIQKKRCQYKRWLIYTGYGPLSYNAGYTIDTIVFSFSIYWLLAILFDRRKVTLNESYNEFLFLARIWQHILWKKPHNINIHKSILCYRSLYNVIIQILHNILFALTTYNYIVCNAFVCLLI